MMLVVLERGGKFVYEGPYTTDAERAKVPADVVLALRLADIRNEFEITNDNDAEWKMFGPMITQVIELRTWLKADTEGDPLGSSYCAKPDLNNPLTAPAQKLFNALPERRLSNDEVIVTALKEYRAVRKKLQDQLAKAQADLHGVSSIRREGILVRLGLLP